MTKQMTIVVTGALRVKLILFAQEILSQLIVMLYAARLMLRHTEEYSCIHKISWLKCITVFILNTRSARPTDPDDMLQNGAADQGVKKDKRKVQGVPQTQATAHPRHQEEEETDKTKQAQIEQTYKKH